MYFTVYDAQNMEGVRASTPAGMSKAGADDFVNAVGFVRMIT